MGFLSGKRALILGLLSDRSIASGIADAMHREGAELAFTYQQERFHERISKLAASYNSTIVLPCDVAEDSQIDNLFIELKTHWQDGFDILVHSIAYAPADQLEGDYLDHINREGFHIAHDISSYSFVALAKAAYPMMQERKGALLTLTYLGADRVFNNYNVMGVAKASLEANMRYMADSLGARGIRVNAVSAGAIRTLAASGIKDFRKLLEHHEQVSPLHKNVSIDQVGNTAAFLCSDLASGITGQVIFVDNGFSIMGIGPLKENESE